MKKLKKGNATWATRKVMLGWTLDTVRGAMELPPHRVERLEATPDGIKPNQRRMPTKTWHKVLGELRSMATAIPGSKGLFSLLQEAFRHEEQHRARLRLNKGVHVFLDNFRWFTKELASRPTRVAELVPTTPGVLGACDASGEGMGGVFFAPDANNRIRAFVWRHQFP